MHFIPLRSCKSNFHCSRIQATRRTDNEIDIYINTRKSDVTAMHLYNAKFAAYFNVGFRKSEEPHVEYKFTNFAVKKKHLKSSDNRTFCKRPSLYRKNALRTSLEILVP